MHTPAKEQVILILLDNALKHSGGPIDLQVSADDKGSRRINLNGSSIGFIAVIPLRTVRALGLGCQLQKTWLRQWGERSQLRVHWTKAACSHCA
jgi:signal transduction histidine kinase